MNPTKIAAKEFLNTNERDSFKKVFEKYCLVRDDFETDADYDDFLEERENLVQSFINNVEREKNEQKLASFYKRNFKKIGARQAEKQQAMSKGAFIIVPLLLQQEISERLRSESTARSMMSRISYNDAGYVAAVKQRLREWEAGADIPLDHVGGLPYEVLDKRAQEELTQSLLYKNRVN